MEVYPVTSHHPTTSCARRDGILSFTLIENKMSCDIHLLVAGQARLGKVIIDARKSNTQNLEIFSNGFSPQNKQ